MCHRIEYLHADSAKSIIDDESMGKKVSNTFCYVCILIIETTVFRTLSRA